MPSEMAFDPTINPEFFYSSYRLHPALWREKALALARTLGLKGENFRAYSEGVNLVAAIDETWVLKIFPPFHSHQWRSESSVLGVLKGALLPVKIPELIRAETLLSGWSYTVMTLLPGQNLEKVWPVLEYQTRRTILEAIGQIMAEVHRVSVEGLSDLPPDWENFLEQQIAACYEHHQSIGMPAWFLRDLPKFLEQDLILPSKSFKVLLTGEYTPFNFLIKSLEEPHIIGMIDFADSMLGPPEYDFLGPMFFLAAGDRILMNDLLRGYAWSGGEMSFELRRRLMSLQILHRYSNFYEQLLIPWKDQVRSLEELEELIWPL